jgi:prolyl oligopeptidase
MAYSRRMPTPRPRLLSQVFIFTLMSALFSYSHAANPPTEKKPVTDEYHGVKVVDDYRWLENAADPAVKTWTDAQNRQTRAYLDALPQRAAIEKQLTSIRTQESPSYGWLVPRPGVFFALKFQPPKQQRLLVTLASNLVFTNQLNSEKVVLDPNELAPKGQVSIDWYVPSPDGKLVAVCLSENGSEDGTLHFYDVKTGKALPDRIARVQYPTGGGSAAWTPDSKAIFYTRYPRAGDRPEADLNFFQQIYLHKLGTPDSADAYSAGQDFPRIAEIELGTSRSGRWLLADVSNGDGGEHAHYVLDTKDGETAAWRQVSRFDEGIKEAAIGCDDATLYLRSVKDAPRGKVLRLPLDGKTELKDAAVIIPESEAVIEGLLPTASYLYLSELIGGPSRLRRFDLEGKNGRELPIPPNSGVGGLVATEDGTRDNGVLFRVTSFTTPDAWYRCGAAVWRSGTAPAPDDDGITRTPLAKTSPVKFDDIEVVREFAVSKDGTRIPLSILHRKGLKLDGQNPTLLTAYGGYGINLRPGFDSDRRLWFDRGGVIVVANVRGGGEYGEDWHLAGNLTRKQTVFDDFAACARHLAERGYTQPAKLAVEGGSNGGLLMGAFLTQHPDMARAVVSHVGLYDMLRVELDPNGAFNVTEFGTVKNPAQFQALHAYSPYHRVVDGTPYPAVFFLAGETDGRVNPAHSRKMTARLQAATASKNPVLVRLSSASGHGLGTALTERIAQEADVFAFLFDQLGMNPPAAP